VLILKENFPQVDALVRSPHEDAVYVTEATQNTFVQQQQQQQQQQQYSRSNANMRRWQRIFYFCAWLILCTWDDDNDSANSGSMKLFLFILFISEPYSKEEHTSCCKQIWSYYSLE